MLAESLMPPCHGRFSRWSGIVAKTLHLLYELRLVPGASHRTIEFGRRPEMILVF